jgi:hypothetical protein
MMTASSPDGPLGAERRGPGLSLAPQLLAPQLQNSITTNYKRPRTNNECPPGRLSTASCSIWWSYSSERRMSLILRNSRCGFSGSSQIPSAGRRLRPLQRSRQRQQAVLPLYGRLSSSSNAGTRPPGASTAAANAAKARSLISSCQTTPGRSNSWRTDRPPLASARDPNVADAIAVHVGVRR